MRSVLSRTSAHPTRPVTVSNAAQGWAATRQTSYVMGNHASDQDDQNDIGGKHVRRPLCAGRHDAGPQPFESLPGHDAVLDGEQREQRHVDNHRRDRQTAVAQAAAIDAFPDDVHVADHEVGVDDKPDQIEEGEQKHQVDGHAVDRDQGATGGTAGRPRRGPIAGCHAAIVLRFWAEYSGCAKSP